MEGKAWLKWREDEKAVSPVIAVILMVAITVVLAAVVYTWASGLAGTSGRGSVQGSCAQGAGNFLTMTQAPSTSVPRASATYRMTDTSGNVWTGSTSAASSTDFKYAYSATSSANIEVGDVIQVNAEPTGTGWSNNQHFTFTALYRGETVLSCPFKWTE